MSHYDGDGAEVCALLFVAAWRRRGTDQLPVDRHAWRQFAKIDPCENINEVDLDLESFELLRLTRVLVVRDEAQDVSWVPVDVEAHSQFAEGELHHKVGVPIRWCFTVERNKNKIGQKQFTYRNILLVIFGITFLQS